MIKPLALSFVLSLTLSGLCVAVVGVNLGGAFAIIFSAMLLGAIAASTPVDPHPAWTVLFAASVGASLAAVGLGTRDAFSLSQIGAIALVTIAVGLAAGSLVRLLMLLRVSPLIASSISITVALAWLSWPIWLSPWLGDEVLASRLVGVHPLLAVNAIAPQFGYWIQQPLMYRLTSLGQDVMFTLPESVAGCVILHLAIAATGALSLIPRRFRHPGKSR